MTKILDWPAALAKVKHLSCRKAARELGVGHAIVARMRRRYPDGLKTRVVRVKEDA